MTRFCIPCAVALVLCVAAASPCSAADDAGGVEFFEKKVRPVLVENCYSCHSVQAGKKKSRLALDSKEDVLKGGARGPAIVPGQPDKSRLLAAIRHDGDLKMPPEKKLPDAVINDIRHWIEIGAPDPRLHAEAVRGIDWKAARQFWSFRPVSKPALPTIRQTTWPKTQVDCFILAGLESAGLRPAAPADKRTLIRRATFDFIGLPPTPEQIDAFLNDDSPRAFERVVNRLLASPHYGERWARHWLDVARYAEDQAHTFGVKPNTEAFRYRDWVIGALNADMPYDRFVMLQIAADLMEEAPKKGTGPLKSQVPSPFSEGTEDYRQRAALGFFGLGAQYYKGNDRALADELDDRVDTLARGFLGLTVSCARCHDHKYDPIPTQDYYSLAGIFHSSKLANLPLAARDVVERFEAGQRQVQEADQRLKDFVRTEKTRLAEAHAGEVAAYLLAAWKVRARRQTDTQFSVAKLAKQDGLNAAALDRCLKLLEPGNKNGKNVAELAVCRKTMPKGMVPEPGPDVVKAADDLQKRILSLLANRDKAPPKQPKGNGTGPKDDLTPLFFGEKGVFAVTDKELPNRLAADGKARLENLNAELLRMTKLLPPAPPLAHGIAEGSPANLRVYLRGDPSKLGETAPRRFLRALAGDDPPRFTKGSGRLELARAIAAKDNPLTARVIVNRIWAWHFGRGIVGTPSNFGNLGERPTHPELLDHLAARFVEKGWSIKWLHREIMLSAVYQLAAHDDPEARQKDPNNRLLWRANRRRLDVESWRDSLLAVAGQLDGTFGGPRTDLAGAQNHKRTVYGKVSRHELNGLLRLFDFPDANLTSERRTETTVPQQQLFALNSPFFVAQAKALAKRLRTEAPDDKARVRWAYLLAFGRPAADAETALALAYLARTDEPAEAARNQLTRWERYAQALLAANEFLYID